MNLIEIFSIIIIHWIADFVLQTDKQAQGKSKNWNDLLDHTITYSSIWFIISLIGYLLLVSQQENIPPHNLSIAACKPIVFTLITFIAHTITDYFTSRLNSRLWEQKKVHNFFVSVGFDQVLHYIQLFTTYYYLKLWV